MTADDWKRRSVCTREESEGVRKTKSNRGETYLEILGNFTNKTLEGELADEELGRLLVATDLAEGDGTGAEAMRLLDTTSRVLKSS